MILYHGSNKLIKNPRIAKRKALLSYGKGFYFTEDIETSKEMARQKVRLQGNGTAQILRFEITKNEFNKLKVLKFDNISSDWFKYVVNSRIGNIYSNDYDIVIGPDVTRKVSMAINLYLSGYISDKIALEMILKLYPKLNSLYVFKTDKALSKLKFMEAMQL